MANLTSSCCALSSENDEVTSALISPFILETSDRKTSIISLIKISLPFLAKVPQKLIVRLLALDFFKIFIIEASLLDFDMAGDSIIVLRLSLSSNRLLKASKSLTILGIVLLSLANSYKALAYLPDNPDDPLILIIPCI